MKLARKPFSRSAESAVDMAANLVILTTEDLSRSTEIMIALTQAKEAIEDFFKESIRKAHELHKSLLDQRNSYLRPVEDARDTVRVIYLKEQDDKREALEQELSARQQEAAKELGVVFPVAPSVSLPSLEAAGHSRSSVWKGEVVDMMEVVRGVVAGKIPLDVLDVNQSRLNYYARVNDGTAHWGGVRFFKIRGLRRKPIR